MKSKFIILIEIPEAWSTVIGSSDLIITARETVVGSTITGGKKNACGIFLWGKEEKLKYCTPDRSLIKNNVK